MLAAGNAAIRRRIDASGDRKNDRREPGMPRHKVRTAIHPHQEVPTIACINRAKTDLDVGFDKLIHALQIYLDDCFVPIWRTPAKLVKATKPRPGAWTMVFLDDADRPETFGRHDHTKNGLPLSRIFVKSTLEAGQSISLVASHELAEMMVDPALNLWCFGPKDAFYVYEVCDPVEEED